jgi:hypothetical protein
MRFGVGSNKSQDRGAGTVGEHKRVVEVDNELSDARKGSQGGDNMGRLKGIESKVKLRDVTQSTDKDYQSDH